MAGILNLSEWSSPFDVWADKTQTIPSTFTENKYTRWGHLKEPVVAEHFQNRHAVKLIESPKRTTGSPEWFAGTPDRLVIFDPDFDEQCYKDPISGEMLCKTGVEIKTALAKHHVKWHESGIVGMNKPAPVVEDAVVAETMVPMHYYVQCQHYMQLMDFNAWYLCVILDSSDYREYKIMRDDDWWDWAINKCDRFWNEHIKKNKPPVIDWGKSVNAFLSREYPECDGSIRDADPLEKMAIKRLKELKQELAVDYKRKKDMQEELKRLQEKIYLLDNKLKPLFQEKDELFNLMRERIADAKGVQCEAGTVTWTPVKGQNRRINLK